MLTLLLAGLVYPLLPTVPLLIALYQCAATGRPRLRWVTLLGVAGIGLLTFPVIRVLSLLSGRVSARDYLADPDRPITPFAVAVAVLPLTVMLTSMA